MDKLPNAPVIKKWWAFMREFMAYNDDDPLTAIALTDVFYRK